MGRTHAPSAAVIADVHGNRWALEAVVADIRRRGITEVYDLGDTLYGPLDPAGTAAILRGLGATTVRGNEDRLLTADGTPSATAAWARAQLSAADLEWLSRLPLLLEVGEVVLFHGTPRSDSEYLLWHVTRSGLRRRSPRSVAALLSGNAAGLALCGHDHTPATVQLPGGGLVVNPGSVGLPAYADDRPSPHAMATGTPHARYAVITLRKGGGWAIEHLRIAYDHLAAAAAAAAHGRDDWAGWLATGRA
jgi:diadenosine tetraphosphatase ApaH/serine/threonine PP2A family protein phosphatase